jgi:membrane-bound ClpP family serine protease
MIITLSIKADDFKLTQMLDKFASQYKVSYTLTRQNEHFILRVKTNDLGELIRRLSHIKDATYKIQEMCETQHFSRMINVNLTKTNIDALVGKTTTAYTDIVPIDGGLVKLVGELWFCRPKYDRIIKKGSPIYVVGVEGVSLTVEEVK